LEHQQQLNQYLVEQARNRDVYKIENYRLLEPGESQYTSDEEGGGSRRSNGTD